MLNPNIEMLENLISAAVSTRYKEVPPTEEEFLTLAQSMRATLSTLPVTDEEFAEIKVLQYSADQWKKLSAFAMQKRMASPDENVALKYACQIPNKMPSGYQSQRLLALLDRALSEGFNL